MSRRALPWLLGLLVLGTLPALAQPRLELAGGELLYASSAQPLLHGRTEPGARVEVVIDGRTDVVIADDLGRFSLRWPAALAAGEYRVTVRVHDRSGGTAEIERGLRVELAHRLPQRPLIEAAPSLAAQEPPAPRPEDYRAAPDRWRLTLPAYEINRPSHGVLDPYNQNKWKGDLPILGDELFLALTAISDTLVDGFEVPTPASVSTARPGSVAFFGREQQAILNQNLFFTADLFHGSTAFKPVDWRLRATVALNLNHLEVRENAAVGPDIRDGTSRTTGRLALQELFYEIKLKDLSAAYDFISVRVGIQPFSSDFRGFLFSDTNLGVRLFGSAAANRYQYNLAYFERLEKGTNSGFNTFDFRDQRVAVLNLYRQDFLVKGYTAQWSVHWFQDEATFLLDRNGFLARPDPVGTAQPHRIEAWYLGWTGFGHLGRWNVDHALYYAFGEDSLNPIAGRDFATGRDDVDISALMAVFELSIDRDWWRPKISLFYASGDRDPNDRNAEGFASIFDNPNFAGGGFSFWNRLGVRLAGTGVSLINRGSLIPDLRSSKQEGQPNFVNPGIWIATLGADLELLPELRLALHASYLRFDATAVLEQILFQGQGGGASGIDESIGLDLSAGVRWRPFLNNNVVLTGGLAALAPGRGFADIYERSDTLFGLFTSLTLTY